MYIPKNHERMQTISEIIREQLDNHEASGGTYDDDRAEQIAGHAIQSCMPGLAAMRQSRVVVEADKGILIEKSRGTTYEGAHVEALFERVALQPLIERVFTDNPDTPLTLTTYDLFAVMRPRYEDPDPQDIIFGDELFIPFADMQLFEPAE